MVKITDAQRQSNKKYEHSEKGKKNRSLRNRTYLYGISKADIVKLLDKQNNLCPICNSYIEDKFYVDHDHKTGKIRGLLCNSCNGGLGLFKDTPIFLLNAIRYLLSVNLQ